MKNISVEFTTPNVYVKMNKKTMIAPSAILTFLSVFILTNFLPQLVPLYMGYSTRSWI